MIFLDFDLGIDYKVMRCGDFRVQQARAQISGNSNPASYNCWEKELHNNRPKTWGIVPGGEPGPCSNRVFFPLVPVRLFLTSVPLMVSIQVQVHRRGSEESCFDLLQFEDCVAHTQARKISIRLSVDC